MSTGYPAVAAKCLDMGIVHDDWQQSLGRLVLGKREDGKYAATVGGVVLSLPRQVGKTFTIGSIVFALCMIFPGLTVLWTAHHTRTSDETFGSMLALSNRKKVSPHIAVRRRANGQQEIRFHNGSRIMFGAREQGFGRGFAGVDVEVFDEAQILSERALEDMVPATNQSTHPAGALLFYMGTPPRPIDPGDVFRGKRGRALSGASTDTVYVEMAADPGASPDDRKQWAKANPSYPVRTPAEAMLRMRENVGSDESYLREGLGVWDELASGGDLDYARWVSLADPDAPRGAHPVFGVDVDEARAASVAVAWLREDGAVHVDLVEAALSPLRTAERLAELRERWRSPVMLGGPSAALAGDVDAAELVSAADFASACGRIDDLLREGRLRHGNRPALNEAVKAARWRSVGTAGEKAWRLKDAPLVGPLAAATRAVHGVLAGISGPSAYEARDLIVL